MRGSSGETIETLARHIMLGEREEAMMELTLYAQSIFYDNERALQWVQRGKAAAEKELRRREGKPLGLPPMAAPYVDVDRPKARRFTAAQMA